MSLVCFSFAGTSFGGITAPVCADFEEVNLRFYVKRQHASGLRRGVVFVRELVPYSAVAHIANVLFGEQYKLPTSICGLFDSATLNAGRRRLSRARAAGRPDKHRLSRAQSVVQRQ